MALNDAQLEQCKEAWTINGDSAGMIARALGVTRNVVIGVIHRRGWVQAGADRRTNVRAFLPRAETGVLKKPPAVKSPPAEKAPPFELDPAAFVDFDQLGPHHCRYPVDKANGEFKGKYCGLVPNGTPYCEGHAKIVYQPSQPYKKRKPRR